MDNTTNSLNWFEIPATDIERATKFYEAVFNVKLFQMDMDGIKMAGFPGEPGSGKASGALAQSEFHKPSMTGTIVYLNANPDMQDSVDRIEANGGKVLRPKTKISDDIGFMAFFQDTEGNMVAIHSQK